jgi:hypothetical protein
MRPRSGMTQTRRVPASGSPGGGHSRMRILLFVATGCDMGQVGDVPNALRACFRKSRRWVQPGAHPVVCRDRLEYG